MTPEKDALLPVTESDQPTRVEVGPSNEVLAEKLLKWPSHDSSRTGPFQGSRVTCIPTKLLEIAASRLSRRDDAEREGEVAKLLAYQHAHEDAVELGYPSLTEALEDLERLKATLEPAARLAQPSSAPAAVDGPPFSFRRYVGGVERAEGVTIERESTLEAAMRKAAAICPKAPCTVLVLEGLSRRDDAEREGEAFRSLLIDVLDTSGARGTYHSRKYTDAIERAEAALSTTTEPAAVARLAQPSSAPAAVGELRYDAAGHAADAVRDACLAILGRVVSFDDSRKIADAVLAALRPDGDASGEKVRCVDDGSTADKLREALRPFADIGNRKASLVIRPDDPIVRRAQRLIERTTGPMSLLEPVTSSAPAGCHCTSICRAPVIMGRQQPCRRPGGVPGEAAPEVGER